MLLNQFGVEGRGLEFLFIHPVSRRHILIGKNLAGFLFFAVINTILIAVMSLFMGFGADAVMIWILQLGVLLVLIGYGNAVSVVLAWPTAVRGKRAKAQIPAQRFGCARPIVGLVSFGILILSMAPLFFLAFWGRDRWGEGFLIPLVPLCIVYSAALYLFFLVIGTGLLRHREPELMALFSRSPD